MDKSFFASFSSEKSSLQVPPRMIAEVVVRLEVSEPVMALLVRAVRALEARPGVAGRSEEQDRQPGGPPAPAASVPGRALAADAGAGGATAEVPHAPPSPPVKPRARRRDAGMFRANWKTSEREARFRAEWNVEMSPEARRQRLAELPGGALPTSWRNLNAWAVQLGLPARPHLVPAPLWRTPEREAQMRADWGVVMSPTERRARLEAHPGPALPKDWSNLADWGAQLGLGRVATVSLADRAAQARAAFQAQREARAGNVQQNPVVTPARVSPPPALLAQVAPPNPPNPPVPKLPTPSNGRHYCSFREIKAWAAHYDIAYNGANIEAVNKRRKLMGLLPLVQDEARTAADVRAA